MQGWKIFVHALSMVVRNWREALRIVLLPTALGAVAVVVVEFALPQAQAAGGGFKILAGLISALIWMLAMVWILVNWHRFILLSEYPSGWLPSARWDAIGAYLWLTVQMTLMAIATLIPFIVLMLIMGGPNGVLLLIWGVAAIYGFYRVSPIMPAAAVGNVLGVRAAWNATKAGAGAILIVIILGVIATQLVRMIEILLTASAPVVGPVLSVSLTAALGLVNASILTTLYGHYIEGRPLGDAGK